MDSAHVDSSGQYLWQLTVAGGKGWESFPWKRPQLQTDKTAHCVHTV